VTQVVTVLKTNAANAARVVRQTVKGMPHERKCSCPSALQHAIQTDPSMISAGARQKLSLLLDKYLKGAPVEV
jgi:hypothetical protein